MLVARRAHDPVDTGGRAFEDEGRAVGSAQPAERGARPAVVRERLLRHIVEPDGREQVAEGPVLPASQHGAGVSALPSGPSSTYTTSESGQLRDRTTTSGS